MKGYVVDKSSIHGKGAFAARHFAPGDYIGVAIINGTSTPDFGKWLNHKDHANAVIDLDDDGKYKVYAGSEINVGEEITVDYTNEPTLVQPKEGWKDFNPNRRGKVQERLATLIESVYQMEYDYITESYGKSNLSDILRRSKKIADGTYAKLKTKCGQFAHVGGITTNKKRLRYVICHEKAQLNTIVKMKTILEGSGGACKKDPACIKGLNAYIKQLDFQVKAKRARIQKLEKEYEMG